MMKRAHKREPQSLPRWIKQSGLLLLVLMALMTANSRGDHRPSPKQRTADNHSTTMTPSRVSQKIPILQERKPCQIIEDWIKVGGTRANFSGIGISGFPKPFPLCFPILAKLSHTAHDRFVNRCNQTYQEVNLAYDMTHEGELWLTKEVSQAYASIHLFSGRRLDLQLHRGDGFYFLNHKGDDCKLSDRRAFTVKRPDPNLGVKLMLSSPPDASGQKLYYSPPQFEDPSRLINYTGATWFSITPANQSEINMELPIEELRALRQGKPIKREISWGGSEPKDGHFWSNRLHFQLSTIGGPGRLRVTPKEGLIARGPDKAGKFNPGKKSFILRNTGDMPIDIAIRKSQAWVKVAPDRGTLAPGAQLKVEIAIDAKALKPKRQQKDTVHFLNSTNSNGNTTRPVVVSTRERWRIQFLGWETIRTSNLPLIAGIRAYWTITVDVTIEGGHYKNGRATATFGNRYGTLKNYSYIPDAYRCRVKKKGIDRTTFNVPGSVAGSIIRLSLPAENYLRLHYACTLDKQKALAWLHRHKYGGQSPEDRVKGVDQELRRDGSEMLPKGGYAVKLIDGQREQVGKPDMLNASPLEILVKKLK